jgi:hypothetical protein
MAVCTPVFDLAADIAIMRSERLEFFDVAAASTASRDKRVVNYALDAMCRVLAEAGSDDRLERTALQLELTGVEEGRYKTSAAYAWLWASITLQQNDTKSARSWYVKWMDRGGLIGMPDEKVFEFLDRYEGILAEWAEQRSFEVAFWIASLTSEDTRKRLIELCGPKAAEVEGMVTEITGGPTEDAGQPE